MKINFSNYVILLSFILFSFCSGFDDQSLNGNVIVNKEVYKDFQPLWELYIEDSKGGWLNNDLGRFSNDDAAVLEGLVYLYEATSDEIYLKHFFEISDRLNERDDISRNLADNYRDNKVLLGWSSTRYTHDNSRHIFNLDDALILFPYVKLYNILKKEKSYKINLLYKRKGLKLLQRAEAEFKTVFLNDWKQITPDSGFFQDPYFTFIDTHMPLNQLSIVGQLSLDLYIATGNILYKNFTIQTANFLKNNLKVSNGACVWNYNLPYSPNDARTYGIDDIGHGSWVTLFIVYCFENNIVFKRNDVDYLSNMFVENISKGSGVFSQDIDGEGVSKEPIINHYYMLSTYNRKIKKIMDDYYYTRTVLIDPNSFLNHVGYHHILYFALKTKYNK